MSASELGVRSVRVAYVPEVAAWHDASHHERSQLYCVSVPACLHRPGPGWPCCCPTGGTPSRGAGTPSGRAPHHVPIMAGPASVRAASWARSVGGAT